MTNRNIKTKSGLLQKRLEDGKEESSQEQDELGHAEHCNATAKLLLVFRHLMSSQLGYLSKLLPSCLNNPFTIAASSSKSQNTSV